MVKKIVSIVCGVIILSQADAGFAMENANKRRKSVPAATETLSQRVLELEKTNHKFHEMFKKHKHDMEEQLNARLESQIKENELDDLVTRVHNLEEQNTRLRQSNDKLMLEKTNAQFITRKIAMENEFLKHQIIRVRAYKEDLEDQLRQESITVQELQRKVEQIRLESGNFPLFQ